jgi:thioredoxin 1
MKEINYANFEQEILKSQIPAVVDFYGEWCGPCKGFTPKLEKLEEEYTKKINFFKIDVDKNQEITERYNVISLPTMIVFSQGKAIFRRGNGTAADLRLTLDKILKKSQD